MLLKVVVIAFFFIACTLASPLNNPIEICGTHISDEERAIVERDLKIYKLEPRSFNHSTTLNVYFHVIAADITMEAGWVLYSQIIKQMQILNDAFSNTGFTWKLVSVDRTINAEWFYNVTAEAYDLQLSMKKTLRKGTTPADLDVYTVGFPKSDTNGYSTYPWNKGENDGIVILHASLPWGAKRGYNLGQTLVHEVGHWGGLYHIFEGGCDGQGDMVNDTPPQARPFGGCPMGMDTCKGGGEDPIHNFMGITSCRNQFTPGQMARFKVMMAAYRGVYVPLVDLPTFSGSP
ncbi:hypothetical protein AMATHDRAFT_86967 [Amanita thiersii Skay4041]|uniref:Peptidase M43 pregnancy-associated plasma-A domain-containing protein n=1 Tax=Amanita thiersii Skay4041 TaxID=703135 RepID=A0A2A9NK47_9AGAR|nr:hypothetical protein AMATHDRAFT_86967 [Amanita thiersii Skay4041]